MPMLNRDVVVVIKFAASCITAGFLIFFISALSGEDLFKNQKTIADLGTLLNEILTELENGIDLRDFVQRLLPCLDSRMKLSLLLTR